MEKSPYKVYVVVDRAFGERLTALEQRDPVWVVNTPVNRRAAERLRRERPAESHLTGITLFNDADGMSPEQLLLSELETIDLHHGSYSADPPYTVLEIYGVALSRPIEAALAEFGFNQFRPTENGFWTSRPYPEPPERPIRSA
jgi:hypothetical protein